MNELDDRALDHVLSGEPPASDDTELVAAIARAERDVERIRRGLLLVAADESAPARGRRRASGRAVAVAAAVAALAAAAAVAVAVLPDDGGDRVASPSAPPSTQAALAPPRDLAHLARTADRVVVGRIERVDRGSLALPGEPPDLGMPYVLATVAVQESLKPAGAAIEQVVAFDYDYGGAVTPDGGGAAWNEGDVVLLFLVSDAGTVSEALQPAHLQVLEGAGGRYPIVDGELRAPFALDEVRAAVGAAG